MCRTKKRIITLAIAAVFMISACVAAVAATTAFTARPISGGYKYLAGSVKETNSSYGTVYISYIQSGGYVNLRAGTSSSIATTNSAKAGYTISAYLPSAYRYVGDTINLYGYGMSGATTASGTWNAN